MSGAKGRRNAVRVVLALAIVATVVGFAAGFGHVYALSDFTWSAGLHK